MVNTCVFSSVFLSSNHWFCPVLEALSRYSFPRGHAVSPLFLSDLVHSHSAGFLVLPQSSPQWVLCLLDPMATSFLVFSRFCRAYPSGCPKKVYTSDQFLEPLTSLKMSFFCRGLYWYGYHFFMSWIENSGLKGIFSQTFEGILLHHLASWLIFEKSNNIMISGSLYITFFFFFLQSFRIFALLSLVFQNFEKICLIIWIFFHVFYWASSGPF